MREFFRSLRRTARRPAQAAAADPALLTPANHSAAPPMALARPGSEQMAFAILLETARSRARWRPATRSALQLALTLDVFRRDALEEGLGWFFLVHPDRAIWQRTAQALQQIGAQEIARVFDDACRTYQRLDHFGPSGAAAPPFAAEEERLWEMKAARRLNRCANRYFWHNAPWDNPAANGPEPAPPPA